jgi:hypothetical protein
VDVYISAPPCIFMAYYLIKHKDNLTFSFMYNVMLNKLPMLSEFFPDEMTSNLNSLSVNNIGKVRLLPTVQASHFFPGRPTFLSTERTILPFFMYHLFTTDFFIVHKTSVLQCFVSSRPAPGRFQPTIQQISGPLYTLVKWPGHEPSESPPSSKVKVKLSLCF